MSLNPQQMAAVKYIDGPLLVLAGAGSGKTRVITQKIAYLIEECGLNARHIFAITFTNKAANEMRERVNRVIPAAKRYGLKVATFHTLGLGIIKQEVTRLGLKPGFSIFDAEDSLQLLRNFLPAARANERELLFKLQQQISHWKNELLFPEEVLKLSLDHILVPEAVNIYPRYQKALKAYNAVDFDDLIKLPVWLLKHHPEVCERWQNKIRHLLVDEYQDSNTCQYELVQLLTGSRARFTVVGDDDQSIYAWRGAKPENLARLKKDYPQLKMIKLEQNYRSTGLILNAANQLIAQNTHIFAKKLWSDLGYGEPIRVLSCKDEQDEAEQVVADLISHKLRKACHYGDYAILYRGNHQSRIFEKILRHHSIPYRISGGQSWFARTEVKDAFAYLKLISNEADDAAFLRIINLPKRGIGEASLEALGNYAQKRELSLYQCADHMALSEFITDKPRHALKSFKLWLEEIKQQLIQGDVGSVLQDMFTDCGYEAYLYEQCDTPLKAQKRMDNVLELVEWVDRMLKRTSGATLSDVINKLILIDILEKADEYEQNTLQLMTLHASKGLEFPHVYLVGMEEELLPHRVSIDQNQIEEERRLAYVGITRAQKALVLTLARQRKQGGEWKDCQPSRFLEELPQEHLEWFGIQKERDEARSKALARSHLAGIKSLLQ